MRAAPALFLVGLTMLAASCGRPATVGPAPGPTATSYQALVAGAPDVEGNLLTQRYDSLSGRAQATAVPTNAMEARFAPAGAVSYLLPDSIHTLDLAGGDRTDATSPRRIIAGYAWSDAGALAYVAHANAPSVGSQLVIRPAGGAARALPLPPTPGGAAPGLRFSPDGQLLLLVDPALGTLQVRRLDGGLAFQAGGASEATWAGPGRVYFMDARGVNVADVVGRTTRTILPGLRWSAPDTSPDGRTVVFELQDGGLPRLELLDTATNAVLPGFERDGGSAPRFVSPAEVWFDDVASGAIVSMDVERRTEAPTGLTGTVMDVRRVAIP
jgi:hypothetical protein